MNTSRTYRLATAQGQIPAVVALLFYLLAAGALGVLLIAGLLFPDWRFSLRDVSIFGRREWLLLVGLAGPLLFAAYYGQGAILTGTSIRAERMSMAHLILQGAGIAWLLLGVLLQPLPGVATAAVLLPGYGLLLCGLVLPWINGLLTASVRNRWDAPSLMVLTALFWLGLSGLYAFGSMLEVYGLSLDFGLDRTALLQLHGLLAIGGGLWLGLLGVSLLSLQLFNVSEKAAGVLSSLGYWIINSALVIGVPTVLGAHAILYPWLGGLFLLGSALVVVDAIRISLAGKAGHLMEPFGWVLLFALLVGLIMWACVLKALLMPAEGLLSSLVNDRTGFSLWLPLIVLLLVFYPVAVKSVPFLVWRIRCMPLLLDHAQPSARALCDNRSTWVTALLLLLGLIYLAAGSRLSDPVVIQLGLLSLLVAVFWTLHALWPAISVFMLGITPAKKTPANRTKS
jgi:hypothetical protein